MGLLLFLILLWLVIAVCGFVIKGLLWLGIIAVVFLVVTGAIGALRHR